MKSGNLYIENYALAGKIWHAYGGFEGAAQTITCTAGTYSTITDGSGTLFTIDEEDGVVGSQDTLKITNAGDYHGTASFSISAVTGKDFEVRAYNVTQAAVMGRSIGVSTTGAGNEMNVCLPLYVEAAANDVIEFQIMSADGTDPVVDDGLVILSFLHS